MRRGLILPVSPCDSIVMALRCPQLLSRHWDGWDPQMALIDGEHTPSEQPREHFPVGDDYEVTVRGLADYYARMEDQWQRSRVPEDEQRERLMGARLRVFLDEGKQVLCVCGAAHWKRIREYLDSGRRDLPPVERAKQTPSELQLVGIDPAIAWLWGWLDDIPRTVWEFEQACQRGKAAEFDKRSAVDTVLRESIVEGKTLGLPVSMRRLMKMQSHVRALTTMSRRWIPELDDGLVASAESCVEERFAEVLKEKALKYSAPLPEGIGLAQVIPAGNGRYLVVPRRSLEAFLVQFPKAEGGSVRRVRIQVPRPITIDEVEQGIDEEGERSLSRRDWPDEYVLRQIMDRRARQLANRQQREFYSRKFSDTMGEGPDWPATIRSYASGDPTVYVRQSRRRHGLASTQSRVIVPVVWIFDGEVPVLFETSGINRDEDRRPYYAGFFFINKSESMAGGEISRHTMAAYVDLHISRGFLGQKCGGYPPTPEQSRREIAAYLAGVPESKKCTVEPWDDVELMRFPPVDQAIVAAVKYAENEVILVSQPASVISRKVQQFADARGVRICRVSIDGFSPKRLERFRTFHWVPSPVDCQHPPYRWCSRFLPPI